MIAIFLLLFGLMSLAISTMIFSGTIDTSSLQGHMDNVLCDYPDYSQGGNWTGNGCLDTAPYDSTGVPACTSHAFVLWNATGAWYSGGNDWVACLPMGLWDFIGDNLTVIATKVSAGAQSIGVYANATVPVSIISEAPILAIPYGFIFLALILGGYLLIHPFKK